MNINAYKIFTRLDAQGNKIPGTSVKRKSMPKTGKWVMEDVNTCCFPYTSLSFTTDGIFNGTGFAVIIGCSGGSNTTIPILGTLSTNSIEELVVFLNETYPYLGLFLEDPDGVTLKLSQVVGNSLCSDLGDLSFSISD